MKSLNNVQLIGHIGVDLECKERDTKIVAKFSLATSDDWLDKSSNQKHSVTEWHKVVCFNKLAEIVKNNLKKGERIYISGKLKTSKWQDKNDEARSVTEIIADELIMLSNKSSENR